MDRSTDGPIPRDGGAIPGPLQPSDMIRGCFDRMFQSESETQHRRSKCSNNYSLSAYTLIRAVGTVDVDESVKLRPMRV